MPGSSHNRRLGGRSHWVADRRLRVLIRRHPRFGWMAASFWQRGPVPICNSRHHRYPARPELRANRRRGLHQRHLHNAASCRRPDDSRTSPLGLEPDIIVVVLHMAQVFIFGAFRRPREATWIAGVLLLLLTLAFGLTGYLLPWDNKAYWGTVVTTKIVAGLPVVGACSCAWRARQVA